jgi:hypothetical protein
MRYIYIYMEGSEVIRIGNGVYVFGIVQGWPHKGLCKINKEPMKDYKKSPINQFLEIIGNFEIRFLMALS